MNSKEEINQVRILIEYSDISQKNLSSSHSKIVLFLGYLVHSCMIASCFQE